MTVRKIGRRWMLLGGASALAIPALPSLLTKPFRAEAQEPASPKRMVAIMSEHGGVWNRDMFPDAALADTSFDHPMHRCFRGTLRSTEEGDERVVSQVLRASTGRLTEALVGKMNVIRGLDVPFYYGHARHILGNYGDMSNNHSETPPEQETADQLMARSSAIYPEAPRRRHINFSRGALSVQRVNADGGFDGPVQPAEEVRPETVFGSVFVPEDDEGVPSRPPPIDRVYESFERLESGAFGAGARLGRADRLRLQEYMDRLSDIRASLSSAVAASCSDSPQPADFPSSVRYTREGYRTLNDIILAAFMCDSSRIAVIRTTDSWLDEIDEFPGGYHEVAHQAAGNDVSRGNDTLLERLSGLLREGKKRFFEEGILDLVTRMDGIADGEGTMLDSSLVWWSPEAGSSTHNGDSIPIVSFGSVGGALQTGQYLDLRDRTQDDPFREDRRGFANEGRVRGACYFQWTTTYLDAFGVPREEWQRPERRAFSPMGELYGWMTIQADQDAADASCDEPLPLMA
ncbi:MAG: DUF1552 domain-containing protein [Myxococcota bacterium]